VGGGALLLLPLGFLVKQGDRVAVMAFEPFEFCLVKLLVLLGNTAFFYVDLRWAGARAWRQP
jgi:hypothetical protein